MEVWGVQGVTRPDLRPSRSRGSHTLQQMISFMHHRRYGVVCRKFRPAFPLFPAVLTFLLAFSWSIPARAFEPVDCAAGQPRWSESEPKLNLVHIFCGDINRRDKPVGFHARPEGRDPATARMVEVLDSANAAGVYTATVEVLDGEHWKEKFSSFFPDRLSQHQVVQLILAAYEDGGGGPRWEGRSGAGFRVQGYEIEIEGETRINTAYPLYQR